jgi:hypothetical protein
VLVNTVLACVLAAAASGAPAAAPPPLPYDLPRESAVGGGYEQVAGIEVSTLSEANDSEFALFWRWHLLEPVTDDDKPYWLQAYVQQSTFVGAAYSSEMGDSNLLTLGGRYYFPGIPLGLGGGFGFGSRPDDAKNTRAGLDLVYFFKGDGTLAFELHATQARWETVNWVGPIPKTRVTTDHEGAETLVGMRWIATIRKTNAPLEITGYYRSSDLNGIGDTGLLVGGTYYFDKSIAAGLEFATDDSDRFVLTGSYFAEKNFSAELELGTDQALGGKHARLVISLRF